MKDKSVQEILEEVWFSGAYGSISLVESANDAKQSLHSLLISKLPEKLGWDMSMDMTGREVDARNSAIDDMRKVMDELFKVEE